VRKKNLFLLLTKHTDAEITDFLQKQAESGWWLEKNNGNRFTFVQKPYEGKRICSYTYFTHGEEPSTEMQLREALPILRRAGWNMICISGPENIADTRRHAFLYDEHPSKEHPIPYPLTDEDQNAFALSRKKRKVFSNLFTCFLYAVGFAVLLRHNLMEIVCNPFYLAASIIFGVSIAFCLIYSINAFISFQRAKKDGEGEIRSGRYRAIDIATKGTSLFLVFLFVFLIGDFLYGRQGSQGKKTLINGTYVRLYADEIPVALENLGVSTDYTYRTSRFLQSRSPFASYASVFDESFGSGNGYVKFIGYTVFQTQNDQLRQWVERELFPQKGTENQVTDIAGAKGLRLQYGQDKKMLLVAYEDCVMVIKAGFPLTQQQIATLVDWLLHRCEEKS
jgi:hypothetical protein